MGKYGSSCFVCGNKFEIKEEENEWKLMNAMKIKINGLSFKLHASTCLKVFNETYEELQVKEDDFDQDDDEDLIIQYEGQNNRAGDKRKRDPLDDKQMRSHHYPVFDLAIV